MKLIKKSYKTKHDKAKALLSKRSSKPITTVDELEYVIHIIESISLEINRDSAELFFELKNLGYINKYMIPTYEVFRSQESKYIVSFNIDNLRQLGVIK